MRRADVDPVSRRIADVVVLDHRLDGVESDAAPDAVEPDVGNRDAGRHGIGAGSAAGHFASQSAAAMAGRAESSTSAASIVSNITSDAPRADSSKPVGAPDARTRNPVNLTPSKPFETDREKKWTMAPAAGASVSHPALTRLA